METSMAEQTGESWRGRNVPEVTSIADALEGLRIADLIIAAAQH